MDQMYEIGELAIYGIGLIGAFKLILNYKHKKDDRAHKTYENIRQYELEVREKLAEELLEHDMHQSEIELVLRNVFGPLSRLDDMRD